MGSLQVLWSYWDPVSSPSERDTFCWHCPVCLAGVLPFRDCSVLSQSPDLSFTSSHIDDSVCVNLQNGLRCQVLNARSVVNKIKPLQATLEANQLDILAITETFLDANILDTELSSDSYTIFWKDRNRHGGGVMLMLKSTIPAIRRYDLESHCELLWIEITTITTKILFGVFYSPPSGPRDIPLDWLNLSLSGFSPSTPIILTGDFNIPDVTWSDDGLATDATSKEGKLLQDIVHGRSLVQLVLKPTRGNNILDLLLTNDPRIVAGIEVTNGIQGSDHDAIQFTLTSARTPLSRHKRPCYNFHLGDFQLYQDILSDTSWDSCFEGNGIEAAWNNFKVLLFSVADKCIPKVRLSARKRFHWLSKETLHFVRKKSRAYKQAKRSGKSEDVKKYRSLSNKVRSLTRKDHLRHVDDISRDLNKNPRKFWRWLKAIKGEKSQIPSLNYKGISLSSPTSKAGAFNDYFSSVFTS